MSPLASSDSVRLMRVPKRPRSQSWQTLTVMRSSHERVASASRSASHFPFSLRDFRARF
jgi:hypothetical protein